MPRPACAFCGDLLLPPASERALNPLAQLNAAWPHRPFTQPTMPTVPTVSRATHRRLSNQRKAP
jgi:hypothetical protein